VNNRVQLFFLYLMLSLVGLVLIFPFYWVVISSVKSREGISLSPPSFYPSEILRTDIQHVASNRFFKIEDEQWFLLAQSPDILSGLPDEGGYFVRLENGVPGRSIEWFPMSAASPEAVTADSLLFAGVDIQRRTDTRERAAILGRVVRPAEDGSGRSEELLFTVPPTADALVDRVEILRNVPTRELRTFKPRWENLAETLRGPEATIGQESTGFLLYLRNSFMISLLAVLGQVFASSLVAYGFARLNFRGRDTLFVLVLATMMIPAQVTLIPMFWIYKSIGWVDTILPLVVPHFFGWPFFIFLMRQYMLTLPFELDESASLDGCGPFRTYYYVILPNCLPAVILVGLLTFIATWQDVMGPLIYLDNPNLRTVTLGLEYFRSPYVDNRHLIMTGALFAMIPVATVFIFFQRFIMAGVATTGLKA
jgi:ABC-type glycerol-3-phosphate transport system permease component